MAIENPVGKRLTLKLSKGTDPEHGKGKRVQEQFQEWKCSSGWRLGRKELRAVF